MAADAQLTAWKAELDLTNAAITKLLTAGVERINYSDGAISSSSDLMRLKDLTDHRNLLRRKMFRRQQAIASAKRVARDNAGLNV